MRRKYLIAFIIVAMMLTFAGCSKEGEEENGVQLITIESVEGTNQGETAAGTENESPEDRTDEAEEQTDVAEDKTEITETEATKTETPVSDKDLKVPQSEELDPMREKYYLVLETLYKNYTLPDGTSLGYNEISDLSENQFAIYDIDQDGKEELIIVWTSTYTAGMSGIVYGYDSASDTMKTELFEYPAQTFYDNGVVEVLVSHNHGLAGEIDDFWPYTFYRYDKNTDTYLCIAEVDAWNKEYYVLDYDGTPFPDELDADGDGILYRVTIGDDEKLIDLEEYKKWQESVIEGAKKVEIPFVKMTENTLK